jgi:hypothetical protein
VVAPALSILILTEDSSPSGHETLTKLARKLLQLVDRHKSNRIHFEPAEPEARLAVRANLWRSWEAPHPRNERSIRILRRTLATKILEEEIPGYVLFHFDGDCPWSEHRAATNTAKFESFREGLRVQVEENLRRRNLPSDRAAVDDRLLRICPVIPFYSIESWLYQNTQRARELCEQACGKHLELIARWEADRSQLDEVIKPKEQLCFGSRKNHELAETFTHQLADELYLLGQSFHAAVERLQACPGLQVALRATWSSDSDIPRTP